MPVKVLSSGVIGVNACPIAVEVDVASGTFGYDTVGLPDVAIRESKQRIQAAMRNSGFDFPNEKIVVNLLPAHVKKEGTAFDLPIALGIIAATYRRFAANLSDIMAVGELSLGGGVLPVRGVLAMALDARERGIGRVMVPLENAAEAAAVPDVETLAMTSLHHAFQVLVGEQQSAPLPVVEPLPPPKTRSDLRYVRGQKNAKRAIEIAAAGGHNILLVGPPGCGKTMLSQCLHGILPELTQSESIEVSRIHSVAGLLTQGRLVTERPFRAPHHTTTSAALIGGGNGFPRPGEVSLAHRGVLFLDEFVEFKRPVREVLRQPMEAGEVIIARSAGTAAFPACFQVVATMNPCPCGFYGIKDGGQSCRCSSQAIQNYQARLSGPLRDRFDLQVVCPPVPRQLLLVEASAEASSVVRERVCAARSRQHKRLEGSGFACNANIVGEPLERLCALDPETREMVGNAMDRCGLSARAFHRAARVARTIADLADSPTITRSHFAEALLFRGYEA